MIYTQHAEDHRRTDAQAHTKSVRANDHDTAIARLPCQPSLGLAARPCALLRVTRLDASCKLTTFTLHSP